MPYHGIIYFEGEVTKNESGTYVYEAADEYDLRWVINDITSQDDGS